MNTPLRAARTILAATFLSTSAMAATPSPQLSAPSSVPVPANIVAASARSPAEAVAVSANYLKMQIPASWRGKSSDWYLAQAKALYAAAQREKSDFPYAGVTMVDKDTGSILASFAISQLQ